MFSRIRKQVHVATHAWNLHSIALAWVCLFALAAGHRALAADCNNNGIEDATDISGGTSLDCEEDGIPDECQAFIFSEDFNGYSPGDEPVNWFDTDTASSTIELRGNISFRVEQVGSDLAFGTYTDIPNIHSHYVGPGAAGISDMTYTGRMRIDDPDGGVGVTFLSQFSDQPSSTYEYVRIRRANYAPSARTFHLAPPNFDNFVGDKDSGVNPSVNTWYRFRVVVDTSGSQLHVQANIWEDGQPEPAGFQIDAVDPSGQHPTSGTVGLWSMGKGGKFWDDLEVSDSNPPVPCDDGDLCTTCDSTTGGPCAGIPVDCSNLDDECNAGTCNAATGLCEAVPANESGTCDDGDACTVNDECGSGVCAGIPTDCTLLDSDCSIGVCNSASGICEVSVINEGGFCDDQSPCTTDDTCNGGTCLGDPVDCSHFDNGCTVGVCNEIDGLCELADAPNGQPCDDLDPCTENDECNGGTCMGSAKDCSDFNDACLPATCNPSTGDCEFPESETDCNSNSLPDSCEVSTVVQLDKITAPDASAGDEFGVGVAIDGEIAVIGADMADGNSAAGSGAAYVYRLIDDAWQFDTKLSGDVSSPEDLFGFKVSVSGNTIVVGAAFDDAAGIDAGAIYVFRYIGGSWQQIAMLTGADTTAGDHFGIDVAIDDDAILAGADLSDDDGTSSGSAYLFREISGVWQQVDKFTASDASAGDRFGRSVALHANTAVIGAWGASKPGVSECGAAYVFREIGGVWQQTEKLTADDAATIDRFGYDIAIDNDTIFVGAYADDDIVTNSGSVYVYRKVASAWQQANKLTADDPTAQSRFGYSVAVDGSHAVIGSPFNGENGTDSGALYVSVFIDDVWQSPIKYIPTDGSAGDQLGFDSAISGETALVSAYLDDDDGTNSGSAHAIQTRPTDCNSNGILDECDIADGFETDCNLNGIPDACEPFGENAQDCSHLDDVCVRGICDLATDSCTTIPANAGSACDDLNPCTENDVCNGGFCAGSPVDCSPFDIDECIHIEASCNPGTGECEAPVFDDCNTNGTPDECEFETSFSEKKIVAVQAGLQPDKLVTADLDNDGDIDVVFSSSETDVIGWYENLDGMGTFGPQQIVSTATNEVLSIFAADIDGDDDQDILSASHGDNKIAWYENLDGLGTFGPQQIITTNAVGANTVFTADLDGDDDIDVISSSDGDNKVAWYENTDGLGSFGSQLVISSDNDGAFVVSAVDLDLDGDLDVMHADRWNHRIEWYKNDGLGNFGIELYIVQILPVVSYAVPTDIDGDGDIDVITVDSDTGVTFASQAILWYENAGGWVMHNVTPFFPVFPDFLQSIRSADLDGDGDNDVLVATAGGSVIAGPSADRRIVWFENVNGQGSFAAAKTLTTYSEPFDDALAADIDGDGRLDVVSASAGGDGIFWNKNLKAHDCNENEIPDDCETFSDGDFDGNSFVDILDFGYLTDCQNGPNTLLTSDVHACATMCLQVFDADADGDIDLYDFASFTLTP